MPGTLFFSVVTEKRCEYDGFNQNPEAIFFFLVPSFGKLSVRFNPLFEMPVHFYQVRVFPSQFSIVYSNSTTSPHYGWNSERIGFKEARLREFLAHPLKR